MFGSGESVQVSGGPEDKEKGWVTGRSKVWSSFGSGVVTSSRLGLFCKGFIGKVPIRLPGPYRIRTSDVLVFNR